MSHRLPSPPGRLHRETPTPKMAGMNQMTNVPRPTNHRRVTPRTPAHSQGGAGAWPTAVIAATLGLMLLAPGCTRLEADWCYRHIQIGQLPRDYRDVLPADASRRTPLGLAYLREANGRRDAIVVLLADDRRVAGKLHASQRARLRGGERQYRLEGRIDPKLYDLAGAGPLDALRAIVADMADEQRGRLARDAYALVGGGLIRLMRTKANIEDVGAPAQVADTWLEAVPPGGHARLETNPDGTIHLAYER